MSGTALVLDLYPGAHTKLKEKKIKMQRGEF